MATHSKPDQHVLPISIIIPTYSEEQLLPRLLESIKKQLFGPSEVIVADAASPDRTRQIAHEYGCRVVEGGRIAVGRNAGANVATQEYLLFLDADTELPHPYVLIDALTKFVKSGVDVASAKFIVSENEPRGFGRTVGKVLWGLSNAIRAVESAVSYPKWEGGAFIMVRRSVFARTKGFDEKLSIGEDHMFFKKAVAYGYKYKHLPIEIAASIRRFDSPKKLAKQLGWLAVETVILTAGVYAGATMLKRFWKWYGRLGGGEGKDPNEE